MSKRGEVTSTQIVSLAIAIMGFVVVLILLWSLEFESYSDEEICRLSVLSRATATQSIGGAVPLKGLIPLKCTTEKICIAFERNGKCEQFAGEKDVVNMVVDKNKVEESARAIEKVNADAMYQCWSMMGEGKLDLFNGVAKNVVGTVGDTFVVKEVTKSCVICSRVAIDRELRDSEKGKEILNNVDVARYIRENGPEGSSKRYLQIYTDSGVSSYPSEFQEEFKVENGKITDEFAYIFMQVLVEGSEWDAAIQKGAATGIVMGSTLFLSPAGKVSNLVGVGTAIKGLITLGSTGISGGLAYYQQGNNLDIAAQSCGPLTSGYENSKGEKVQGCSIVKPFDYNDISEINEFCTVIEGSP